MNLPPIEQLIFWPMEIPNQLQNTTGLAVVGVTFAVPYLIVGKPSSDMKIKELVWWYALAGLVNFAATMTLNSLGQ